MTTARKKPAAKKPELVEDVLAASKESVETAMKAGADAAAEGYEKAFAATKEQFDAAVQAGTDAFKSYEELAAFGKGNMEAVVESGNVLAQGIQELNKTWTGLAQRSVETTVANTKALFGCKNLTDAFALQSDWAQAGYQTLLDDTRAVSDLSVKVANEAMAPLAARVNEAVKSFGKPLSM